MGPRQGASHSQGCLVLTQAGPAVRMEPESRLALAEVGAWCVHTSVLAATVVQLALIHVWTGTQGLGLPASTHLGGPQGPQPGPLPEDMEPHPGARAPSSEPTLAGAEWGEGRARPSHLASLLGGKSHHPGGGQNVGRAGGQTERREQWSGQRGGCRGHWAEAGKAPLLMPFKTELGAKALSQSPDPEVRSGRAGRFSGTHEPKGKNQQLMRCPCQALAGRGVWNNVPPNSHPVRASGVALRCWCN